MTTDISICSTGLLLVGADDITSFDDETREARLSAAMYPTTRDSELQKHDWIFSRQQTDLARSSTAPLFDYSYAHQIPTDSLKLIALDINPSEYRVFQDKIFSNVKDLKLFHQVRPNESDMPSYFVRLLEYKMAEIFSTALLQDDRMSQLYRQKYDDQYWEAKKADSQQEPSRRIPFRQFEIASVRHT